jgi:hypothetical protein
MMEISRKHTCTLEKLNLTGNILKWDLPILTEDWSTKFLWSQ